MHPILQQLTLYLQLDDSCEDYEIYLPTWGCMITANTPGRGPHRFNERAIEQIEVHDGEVTVIMKDDYDNPISESDLSDVKFNIYEIVATVRGESHNHDDQHH